MIDDRIILEPGASVPVFRQSGAVFGLEPPGQFVGAVLRIEQGYEAWRYGSKTGQPIATSPSLAEAVEAFAIRTIIERPPSTTIKRRIQQVRIRTVWCGSTYRCECGERKYHWGHAELRDLATGEVLS